MGWRWSREGRGARVLMDGGVHAYHERTESRFSRRREVSLARLSGGRTPVFATLDAL